MGSMKKFGFKNIFIGLIVVSIIYLIVIFVYLFAFKTEDKIVLIGESEKIVKVGTKYVLDGAKVYSNYQSNDILIIENKVNINKIGEYDVVYTYKDLKVIRKVKVIDDTPPSITLVGDNPSLYCSNKGYVEEGYKVVDNYDKDLNDKVVITKEEGYINYYVKDSSGNSASIKRKIVIGDKDAPLITLTGGNNITLYKGEKYKDQYKAVDNCDGDITSKVLVTGSVDTNTLG